MNTASPTPQPAQPIDLDAMAAAAMHRLTSHINRAAGQHLRALRRTSAPVNQPPKPKA